MSERGWILLIAVAGSLALYAAIVLTLLPGHRP